MVALAIDGQPLSDVNLFFLAPLLAGDARGARRRPRPARRRRRIAPTAARLPLTHLQQALDGLPLAAIYALLAAAYSLVYGLVGRINLAFGDFAAAGGYAAALGALLTVGQTPATILVTALALGGAAAALVGDRDKPLGFLSVA